jgi:predicted nuclease of predicted toxin-antitoxin system
VKALLDEQLSPQIAAQLRERGHDVIAVGEREDLMGSSDRHIIDVAFTEGRAVITNNVKDFRPLAAERLARDQQHGGLILLPSTRMRTRALVEPMADAIDAVMRANPHGLESSERWIGPAKGFAASDRS